MFLGAPAVAREAETGTAHFAWTQAVTRRRWLTVKAGWLLLAAARLGRRRRRARHLVVGAAERRGGEPVQPRQLRRPGHHARRLLAVRDGARHRGGHADPPGAARARRHPRRVLRRPADDQGLGPPALHDAGHQHLQRRPRQRPPGPRARPGFSAQGFRGPNGPLAVPGGDIVADRRQRLPRRRHPRRVPRVLHARASPGHSSSPASPATATRSTSPISPPPGTGRSSSSRPASSWRSPPC